ncbi:MAG: substrate-binding domain-containing protein, partial [Bifidobacteriaceae bacterium]|nr:substrate-binding domain-containing protein [Bifidobacteriaceae bacterium]
MVSKKYLRTVTAALAVGAMLLAGGCSSNKEEKPVESTPAAESPAPVDESPAAEPPVEEPVTAGLLTAGDKIAVSMPWQGTQNFKEAVEQFPAALEGAGWTNAGVLDANNKAETQQQQIQQFIADGAKAIIIGAVDGKQLSAVVEDAKAQGIVILGYDRLIEGTEAVDGVVQYGSIATGKKEAEALVQGLQEKVSPDGPWTIELFAGGPSDPNAKFFFDGAMEVLQPLIDAGQIKVGSGQVDFETVATPDWDNGKAQTRMDSLLTGNYAGGKSPDGVLAPNDG